MSDETKFFVYKLICDELGGLFYIGSHHCTGKPSTCRGRECKYMGSSSIINSQYADFSWRREIVEYAQDRKELSSLEVEHIKENIDDLFCLNQVIASPTKGPTYTKSAKRRLKQSVRRDFVLMVNHVGDEVSIRRSKLFKALKKGYEIRSPNIHLINNRLKKHGQFSSKTIARIYQWIEPEGWTFGFNGEYERMSASDLLNSIGVVRETVVTYNFVKVTV